MVVTKISINPVLWFYQIKRYLLILVSIGFLNACTGLQTAQDYLLNNEEGLAFFSMTQSGVLSSSFQLTFVNEKTGAQFSVNLRKDDVNEIGSKANTDKHYRAFDKPAGKLVVLRLPEGVYQLKHWNTTEKKKTGKNSLSRILNKKFRIMNAHALYLGNIHNLNSVVNSSVFIRDYRIRDISLFKNRYPRVEKAKLLISSKAFLNPAAGRDRVFDAFASCTLEGYQLISKKRLPAHIENYRTIRIGKEEKKISRIDGYRLKFRSGNEGPVTLNMKIEMSAAKEYTTDKKYLTEWFDNFKKTTQNFEFKSEDKGYFSEYQMKTFVLSENRMVYMVVMFDDSSQMITNMTFINPPEYLRTYQTFDEFLPMGIKTVNAFQQCAIDNLNNIL